MEKNESLKHLKKNTLLSALSLFFQSGYSAFLGLIANVVLTIFLSPKIFGIYITVLSMISILNYFSDIGLAASLVQKKEITNDDIKTTFTIQQTLIIMLILFGIIASTFVQTFYQLPPDGIHLYHALLFSFFISSLKTIPSIFLERKIQFQKIVLVQIVENTVFYISTIILALMHFELMSFTYAVIIRAFTGLIFMYSLSFWIPQIGISRKSMKTLLSFGIPFQASSFLALFKDDLLILYLGKIIGFEALGYIGWAKKWAESPIRIIMDNISRVLFPVISRIQNDREKIISLIEKILYYQTLLLAPILMTLALLMNDLVLIVPKYAKWLPALPLFYIFCVSAFFSSFSTPFINLFNALGKVKITFSFMVFWTVATWILTPILTLQFGTLGFPITLFILSLTFIVVVKRAKQDLNFHFFSSIQKPIIATVCMSIPVLITLQFNIHSILGIFISISIGVATYFFVFLFMFKINLIKEILLLFSYE